MHRRAGFSRPKPENVELLERVRSDPEAEAVVEDPVSDLETSAAGPFLEHDRGALDVRLSTRVTEIRENSV
ncbi:MAG: hypothetical protein GTN89_02155, partial [Acidobacteria bacterium]|nr:hypothetical protein [Acidobacteriota bacterium]NIM61649.1 hypothetical protein [Acidobacteriota bacterium]NIO58181.1 hypothetical protein [Acidobacteriota bacterium]NIQ29190.1 hypothetical protein [Acidobacteriota bacterium]NIQ83734.1 hypothetical protein [Acidobacteriota bacterium]